MAVARITASKRALRSMANHMRDHKRAGRELERAIERPGLTAELDADELRLLVERCPRSIPVREALARLETAERSEAERRARIRDLQEKWPRNQGTGR